MPALAAEVDRPRWTQKHPRLPILYAAVESPKGEGAVFVYAVDRKAGTLRKLSEQSAGGSGTTHLWLDAPSMDAAGGQSGQRFNVQHGHQSRMAASGRWPRPSRPAARGRTAARPVRTPMASQSIPPGATRWWRIWVRIGSGSTVLIAPRMACRKRGEFVVPPGSGPRHLVFGADGRFVYLLNELSADLMILRWDGQAARLSLAQALPISGAEFKGTKNASEIALSPDGRFLYLGDRGENTLVVYRLDAESGLPTLVQRTPSGGDGPWNFVFAPSGRWLLVANNRSNRVNVFAVDPVTGRVADSGRAVESPAPVSLEFVN